MLYIVIQYNITKKTIFESKFNVNAVESNSIPRNWNGIGIEI
jgi:hypothetical protein